MQAWPDGWYAVAFSDDVPVSGVVGRKAFDLPLAVWRDAGGRARVHSARCPHMGAHLGAGSVDADVLVCPLHGWSFDAEGRCMEGGESLQTFRAEELGNVIYASAKPDESCDDLVGGPPNDWEHQHASWRAPGDLASVAAAAMLRGLNADVGSKIELKLERAQAHVQLLGGALRRTLNRSGRVAQLPAGDGAWHTLHLTPLDRVQVAVRCQSSRPVGTGSFDPAPWDAAMTEDAIADPSPPFEQLVRWIQGGSARTRP